MGENSGTMEQDLEVGVALFNATGISSFEAQDPTTAMKLQELADFFGNHPDAVGTIRQVTRSNKNPQTENVDHLLAFVKLNKEKMDLMKQV